MQNIRNKNKNVGTMISLYNMLLLIRCMSSNPKIEQSQNNTYMQAMRNHMYLFIFRIDIQINTIELNAKQGNILI